MSNIAIVGMSGRYACANDIDSYWQNLLEGKDCLTEVPADRWALDRFFDPSPTAARAALKSYTKMGGFVDGIDEFDELFFNISPMEAVSMDPQHRLYLQEAYKAFEDAGFNPRNLKDARCGAYLGIMHTDYGRHLFNCRPDEPLMNSVGTNHSIAAARIVYFLDMKGAALAVDTACSSSLVCVHMACQALRHQEIDMALVAGVTLQMVPDNYISLSEGGVLSVDGRASVFDESANGIALGEGIGCLVLKRQADAERDRDPITALIVASGVNQDGKTNSMHVPSARRQAELEAETFRKFGIDPRTITYAEMHGTGTKLGDPIELEGLCKAFREFTDKTGYCAIGSVKSNIGHTFAASGIASVQKVALMMRHRKLVPTLHFSKANKLFDFDKSPFYVNQVADDWRVPEGQPRRACVSSFGLSGTNAHIVMEEYPDLRSISENSSTGFMPVMQNDKAGRKHIVVFSAKTSESLAHKVAAFLAFLQTWRLDAPANAALRIEDVAHTLQVGREEMDERLALLVDSMADMQEKLHTFLKENEVTRDMYRGHVQKGRMSLAEVSADGDFQEALVKWMENGKYGKLAELWVNGLIVDWDRFYPKGLACRINLPGYAFARTRHRNPVSEQFTAGRKEVGNNGGVEVGGEVDSEVKSSDSRAGNREHLPERECRAPLASPAGANSAEGTTVSWLSFAEDFISSPMSDAYDWNTRLSRFSGSILILYSEKDQQRRFSELLERVLESAAVQNSAAVRAIDIADLELETVHPLPDVVFVLASAASQRADGEFDEGELHVVFKISQYLMRKGWENRVDIFLLYRCSDVSRLELRPLYGLLNSAMMENENHKWTIVACIGQDQGHDDCQLLIREWLYEDAGTVARGLMEIHYRKSRRYERRLREVELNPGGESVFRVKGTYLITGGFGPMGRLLCEKLAREYQATLVVFSRSEPGPEQRAFIERLEAFGSSVHYHSVDITDRTALESAFALLRKTVGPLQGVMLLANLVNDEIIATKSWESFRQTMAPKVVGSLHIDALTAGDPLDFFMFFSSSVAFGIRGSSDYSYSAAFQNVYADYRNKMRDAGTRSGYAISFCWGPWTIDYYLRQSTDADRYEKISNNGAGLIDIEMAFPVIEASHHIGRSSLALVAALDKQKLLTNIGIDPLTQPVAARPTTERLDKLLAEWTSKHGPGVPMAYKTLSDSVAVRDLDSLDATQIEKLYALLHPEETARPVTEESANVPGAAGPVAGAEVNGQDVELLVAETISQLLRLDNVDRTRTFQNYGVDSILAMKFAARLEQKLKQEIQPKWLVEFPTVTALSGYLATQL